MARFLGVDDLFEGWHFNREIIVLCERWYLHFKLSFRDLVEMMEERGRSGLRWTLSVGQESGRLKRESHRVPTPLPIRG